MGTALMVFVDGSSCELCRANITERSKLVHTWTLPAIMEVE